MGLVETWLEQDDSGVYLKHSNPYGGGTVRWDRCVTQDCLGEALQPQGRCLAHISDADRIQYLSSAVTAESPLFSLRGVEIQEILWNQVRAAFASIPTGVHPWIAMSGAIIEPRLELRSITFKHFDLNSAVICSGASFYGCAFEQYFGATYASLENGGLDFTAGNKFFGLLDISFVNSSRARCHFSDCNFSKALEAKAVTASLGFSKCDFRGDVLLSNSKVDSLSFDGCLLCEHIDLSGVHCGYFGAVNLRAERAHQIGPFNVTNSCNLQRAKFDLRIQIEVAAELVDLSGARFPEGGRIMATGGRLNLASVTSGRALQVLGAAILPPSIITLSNADSGTMTFSSVDMSRCIFYGAHNLDKATIEPNVTFAKSPWLGSSRRCIADEFACRLRLDSLYSFIWKLSGTRYSDQPPIPVSKRQRGTRAHRDYLAALNAIEWPIMHPSQVASVYRSLRKSYETASNQPGAADFYYGEMEMRRLSSDSGLAERSIVIAYWVIAGYGLRASRAFVWLIAVVVFFGWLTSKWGFAAPTGILPGILFVLRSAIPGIKPIEQTNGFGAWVQVGDAIIVPALFAMGILALRNRIRR